MVPSFDGVVTQIAAQAADWGTQAGEAFAETFKELVNAELKDMDAVKIDADISEASAKAATLRAEIDNLNAEIDLGIDETDTQEKLAALQAELAALELEHPEIRIGIDTGEAEAGLVAFDADVVASTAATDALSESVGGAGAGIEGAGAAAGEASGGIGAMQAGLGALAVALVPIGGLALGAFAAIPALIAGALAGVGTLYAAFEPIVTTLEAFGTRNSSSGSGSSDTASTALSNATAERDAAYSVQQAEESLANAQVSGAQAVANAQTTAAAATVTANNNVIDSENALVAAERAVTEAQYNEQQAQEAVVAARQAAQNQLEDYTNQLADNAIAQQQDQLNLQEAQENLASATQPGSTATADQQSQAQINLEQAQQALTDLNTQNSQLATTAAAAFAAGVDGASGVLDAEHNLGDATQATTDALAAQQTAQLAVVTASADAAQQIITNELNIAQARAKDTQGIQDAEKALEQALANQKDAFTRASIPVAGASSSVKTYADDFAKLTPAGKDFVDFVTGKLMPAFMGISDVAQKGLLPGLEKGLEDMLPLFKDLKPIIGDVATGIGDLFANFGDFAGSASGIKQIQDLFANGVTFMGDLGQAAEIFLEAFIGVGSQSKPIIDALGTGIVNIAKSFLNWVATGGFQGFLTWLSKNGPTLVSDLGDFLKAAGKLLVAITPLGGGLDTLVGDFSDVVSYVAPLIKVFSDIGTIILALATYNFGELHKAFDELLSDLGISSKTWSDTWADIKKIADDAWNYLDEYLFSPISNFFTITIPKTFDNFVADIKALPKRAEDALGDFASEVWSGIVISADWLDTHVWDPIESFFTGLPDKIGHAAEHMWDGIEAAFVTVLDDLIGFWNGLHFTLPSVNILGHHIFGGQTVGMPPIPLIPIPSYHTGGVVAGTPGVEQLALLMPGEIVTPANTPLPPAFAGGSNVLQLTLNGVDLSNVQVIERVVVDAFSQWTDEMQSSKVA
jgi:hypothetical protein